MVQMLLSMRRDGKLLSARNHNNQAKLIQADFSADTLLLARGEPKKIASAILDTTGDIYQHTNSKNT